MLPGDCIGPEIMAESHRVLARLAPDVELEEQPFGAAAIRATGTPLPEDTLAAAVAATAVLKGPVGDPEFDGADVRPEQGLLGLRKALDVYANLRPARGRGIDLLVVRELVGGLYFGEKGVRADGTVFDTCEYHPDQVERIARRAFSSPAPVVGRSSRSTRRTCSRPRACGAGSSTALAPEYDDVSLEHMLVDNAAMQLVRAPEQFDVILTENTFGDILSDVAAEVTGGLGLSGSASLGDGGPGLFEPSHGSAPDIAGQGLANPTGMLRSAAMLLEHALGRREEAARLDAAVDAALESAPTSDLGGTASTSEFGDAVLARL